MLKYGLGFSFEGRDNVSNVANRVNRSIASLKVKSVQNMQNIQNSFMKVGMGISQISAGLAQMQGIKKSISAFSTYEKGLAEINTLLNAEQIATSNLGTEVRALATTYGGDMTNVTKGFYDAISSGAVDASNAMVLMTQANKMAIGGVTDVATAVDGMTSVLNAYDLSVEESTNVSDAFFVAMREGKTTISELSHDVGRVASTAKNLGIGYNELLASIATGTKSGLQTNMMVSGLNAAMQNLIKPSTAMTKALRKSGMEMGKKGILQAGGLVPYLINLKKVMPEREFQQAFSARGLNAVLALIKNDGKTANGVLEAMGEKAGATNAAYKTMAKTMSAQTKILKANFNDLLIGLGKLLLPTIIKITERAKSLISSFQNLSDTQKKAILIISSMFGGLSILSGSLMLISGLLGALKGSMFLLISPLTKIGLLFSPLGLIVAGIGIAFAIFVHNAGGLSNALEILQNKLQPVIALFRMLYETIRFGGIRQSTMNEFKQMFDPKTFNTILAFYVGIVRAFAFMKKAVIATIDFLGKVLDVVIVVVKKIKQGFMSVFNFYKRMFKAMAGALEQSGFLDGAKNIGDAFSEMFGLIGDVFDLIVNSTVFQWLGNVVGFIFDGILKGVNFLKNHFSIFFEFIYFSVGLYFGWIIKGLGFVAKGVAGIFRFLRYTIENFKEVIGITMVFLGGALVRTFDYIWQRIKWIGNVIKQAFMALFEDVAYGVGLIFSGIINKIVDGINFLIRKANTIADKLGIDALKIETISHIESTLKPSERVMPDFEFKPSDDGALEKAREDFKGMLYKSALEDGQPDSIISAMDKTDALAVAPITGAGQEKQKQQTAERQTVLLSKIFAALSQQKDIKVVLEGNLEAMAEGVSIGAEESNRRNFVETGAF